MPHFLQTKCSVNEPQMTIENTKSCSMVFYSWKNNKKNINVQNVTPYYHKIDVYFKNVRHRLNRADS